MNNIPVKKNGAITISEPGLPLKEWKKQVPIIEASIKRVPPITSRLQDKIRIAISISTGILCIRNPNICALKGSFPSNTSNENIIIKKIETIDRTLGIQYKIFDVILSIVKCNKSSSLLL